ncbi:hypothetical protein AMTRI_Chr06g178970 [Amborella trichopoda]|uniref:uncharacterized protein LOC18448575 n=1 Tax=Amborella trichopoda TaxID=13333 RepID=UPI0005D37BF1|nr:uncharacterized protein LOC18448575 [Amborella trichopoda]|eukprot:XP_006858698.2 uncharacterized protein LOC18448575 [Amborella trichopoda]
MLENSSGDATVKRYVPPRNRVLNRRKSGDRFERLNYFHGSEGERSIGTSSKNSSLTEHGEAGSSSSLQNDTNPLVAGSVLVDGCSNSEAAKLMSERWAAAMSSYNDPSVEVTEKPVMYSGSSGSAWGSSKLTYHTMDFFAELQKAILASNAKD